ncbi:MAG: PHB depolymerase family esterase, partial [Ramlibacter sp.]
MNPIFQRLMQSATRLVRGGDVKAATAAIQAALAGNDHDPNRADHHPNQADPSPVRAEPVEARGTANSSGDVIDVVTREVPQPETGRPPTSKGRFNDGTYADATGQQRAYKLYLPPEASDHPRPLIVMLHGCTQDAGDFATGTAMNELARLHGFFVLYPEQSRQANPQGCWNWFKHSHQVRDRGEPALLAGMTREVIAGNSIDPARVYVAGLSAGGAMAAILGDAYPDIFAAVGVHSGLATGVAKDLPSAFGAMKGAPRIASVTPSGIPTIVFHGDADSTVHPGNGAHV